MDSKLTYLEDVGRNKNSQLLCKYKCECGNECVKRRDSVLNGNTKSCGCMSPQKGFHTPWMMGNTNRRKQLSLEEIPEQFRDDVQLNVSTQKIGKRHRELFSIVKCVHCERRKMVRNSRIRENIRNSGYLWHCHNYPKDYLRIENV